MVREQVFMSVMEVDRLAVIREVAGNRLLQREAAERLGVGVRQIKRLVRDYRERGAAGLVSVRRGRRPNNAIGAGVREEVMALVRKHYADFGPTLACEKLVEDHGRRLSAETLRHLFGDNQGEAMRPCAPVDAARLPERRSPSSKQRLTGDTNSAEYSFLTT